jgi:hypothetical protein
MKIQVGIGSAFPRLRRLGGRRRKVKHPAQRLLRLKLRQSRERRSAVLAALKQAPPSAGAERCLPPPGSGSRTHRRSAGRPNVMLPDGFRPKTDRGTVRHEARRSRETDSRHRTQCAKCARCCGRSSPATRKLTWSRNGRRSSSWISRSCAKFASDRLSSLSSSLTSDHSWNNGSSDEC